MIYLWQLTTSGVDSANTLQITSIAPEDLPKTPLVDQSLYSKTQTSVDVKGKQGSPLDLIHVKAAGSPKPTFGTSPSSADASLKVPYAVASALPASPTLQGDNKTTLMAEETAHVSEILTAIQKNPKGNDNRTGGNPRPMARTMHNSENSLIPLTVSTLSQAPGTNEVPPIQAAPEEGGNGALSKAAAIHEYNGNGNFLSVVTTNHGRAARKRKLSERGKESLERAIGLDDIKDAVQLTALSVHSSPQSSQEIPTIMSRQSNLIQASDGTVDPPTKKRGRPKKMQVSDSQQGLKSQGRPRKHPQPKIQSIMPITPSKINTQNPGSTIITSSLLATNLTNNYSMPAPQSDFDNQIYPDQFVRNHPMIPRSPATNLETVHSTPERRPRGRPKKAVVKKPVPATPVAIKPKPIVNREPNRVDSEWRHSFPPQG